MASQNVRYHPYSQSTLSLSGDSSPDVFNDTMGGGTSSLFCRKPAHNKTNPILERILQELGNLSNKSSQFETMSGQIDQVAEATSTLSNKINALSIKMEKVIETVASLSSAQQVLTLPNKVDHLAATVAQLSSASAQGTTSPGLGANPVATTNQVAPWAVLTALKERVYQLAYALVPEATLDTYTAIHKEFRPLVANGWLSTSHLPSTGSRMCQRGSFTISWLTGKHVREKMHLLITSVCNTNPNDLDVEALSLWNRLSWAHCLCVAYLFWFHSVAKPCELYGMAAISGHMLTNNWPECVSVGHFTLQLYGDTSCVSLRYSL
ncbi:uncharacterized protein MELLADRAFT_114093 [Melampsora larici-populina 98AG31]|uniref:Uncharacterized protein n=1 Tax=Melampsora larici-populina (strain 98AG31 / pathotype 3-4-7) TaxID=747676 RepID=F4SC56_MELLP|nr:uncharacterized protein MELLADRAFT_114093 [Melampsora larici-populina 98AG31]EGF97770.1 hypothetical protein MELLADRAFT_114093 [Melampsora larici-populina 98AG31]